MILTFHSQIEAQICFVRAPFGSKIALSLGVRLGAGVVHLVESALLLLELEKELLILLLQVLDQLLLVLLRLYLSEQRLVIFP